MRLRDADAASVHLALASCQLLLAAISGHRSNAARACAAGVMEALASIMATSCAREGTHATVYIYAMGTLDVLLQEGHDDAVRRAVHAGVLDIMAREGTQRFEPRVVAAHAHLVQRLEAAAALHDAGACAHDGCTRCAAARAAGAMCALAGCGARARADGGAKKLLRCGTCRAACYCGPAHQREDWARHKDECAALRAAHQEGEQQRGD
jgi:hypothetical protein